MPKQFRIAIGDRSFQLYSCRESAAVYIANTAHLHKMTPDSPLQMRIRMSMGNTPIPHEDIATYLRKHIPYVVIASGHETNQTSTNGYLTVEFNGTYAGIYSAMWWGILFCRLLLREGSAGLSKSPIELIEGSRTGDSDSWYSTSPKYDRDNAAKAWKANLSPEALVLQAPRGPASYG